MKALQVVAWLLLFLLIGCEKGVDVTSSPAKHQRVDGLIPMKAGYYWVYLLNYYDTTGLQYPWHYIDTVKILRDTMINNELWFIFNDGTIQTNRNDGVWFLDENLPRRDLPVGLNDSSCIGSASYPCESYIKLVAINQPVYVIGKTYDANVYDWIWPEFGDEIGYRYYTVPHLGHIRKDSYATTPFGYHYAAYSKELIYSFVY